VYNLNSNLAVSEPLARTFGQQNKHCSRILTRPVAYNGLGRSVTDSRKWPDTGSRLYKLRRDK